MTIDQLIAANTKTSTNGTPAKPEKTRFMLELSNETRSQLEDLCVNKLGCKQISFASELFTVALNDAIAAYMVAVAPKAPTPPALPKTK